MNRQRRRAAARSERRSKKVAALGSAAVLASAGVGAALVFASGTAGATGTTYVVNTTADTTDGVCDVADCSLRDAIDEANANAGQDTITFSVTGTITLTSDLTAITDAVHVDGPGAEQLTIDGDGNYRVFLFDQIYAVDGTDAVTGLTVTGGNAASNPAQGGGAVSVHYGTADLNIADVVFTNNDAFDGGAIALYGSEGVVTITNAEISGNRASDQGGGLYVWGQIDENPAGLHVTISHSTIADNDAYCTGVITGNGGGGGIYLYDATLEIVDSVISGNETSGNDRCGGGGVHANEAVVSITGSTISDNTVENMGAGLYFNDATVTVARSTISGNAATGDGGGGVATFGTGTFALVNSTVSNNTGYYYGGGLYLCSEGSTIVQSTISGNSSHQAGGIYAGDTGGTAILLSTITDNTATGPSTPPAVHGLQVGGGVADAGRLGHREDRGRAGTASVHARAVRSADDVVPIGTAELIGTIVAGNGNLDVGGYKGEEATIESLGSILGAVDPATVTVHDHGGTQTGVPAAALALGPLADNGGPTLTHALLPGSVAIDAGPATTDLPTFPGIEYDQRGEPYVRIVNGTVDVGAYEVQPPPEPTFTG